MFVVLNDETKKVQGACSCPREVTKETPQEYYYRLFWEIFRKMNPHYKPETIDYTLN